MGSKIKGFASTVAMHGSTAIAMGSWCSRCQHYPPRNTLLSTSTELERLRPDQRLDRNMQPRLPALRRSESVILLHLMTVTIYLVRIAIRVGEVHSGNRIS